MGFSEPKPVDETGNTNENASFGCLLGIKGRRVEHLSDR